MKNITPSWTNTWIFLPRRKRANFKRSGEVRQVFCINHMAKCRIDSVTCCFLKCYFFTAGWWTPRQRASELLRILSGVCVPDPSGAGQEEVWCSGACECCLWCPTLPLCYRTHVTRDLGNTQNTLEEKLDDRLRKITVGILYGSGSVVLTGLDCSS